MHESIYKAELGSGLISKKTRALSKDILNKRCSIKDEL